MPLTPDLVIAGSVATISSGEPAYTNVLVYTVQGYNNWFTLGSRVGNGTIDFSNINLPNGNYTARVMSISSPGTVSDSVDFTIANPVVPTLYPDPNWDRWIFASVSDHFVNRTSYPVYIEGQHRETNELESFIELRIDGPYYTEYSKGYWRVYVEINVMCQHIKNNTEWHAIRRLAGHVATIFEPCIRVYKYGNGPSDDQTLLDSLIRMDSKRERIQTSHFGQIEPRTEVEQATVEAHYEMMLSV